MRIDLNPSAMPELASGGEATAATKPQDMTAAPNADDVAHLSSGSDAVAGLKAQLDAVPDIRLQRVAALQQAISEGTYQISPQAVAGAMLGELRL